jgi:hypothetical protein
MTDSEGDSGLGSGFMWQCDCDKGRLISGVVVFTTCFQRQRGLFRQLLKLSGCESGGEVVDCLEWSGGGCDEAAHPVCQLGHRSDIISLLHCIHWRAWG